MSTLSSYLSIASNMPRWQKMTAAEPDVASATKYFKANIGNVTTAKQLVGNTRLFDYVMNAFGLGDMTYAKAMVQKVLEQGTTDSKALANTLHNQKILALAQAFDFAGKGAAATQSSTAMNAVVDKFVMQRLESDQGAQNTGVQLALYFKDNASKITNAYSILADRNLLKVVQTTFGLSSYTSMQNIDTQARQLDKLLKYSDFQDTTKVGAFVARFSAQYDAQNPTYSGASASTYSAASSFGLDASLLMSLQNIRLRA